MKAKRMIKVVEIHFFIDDRYSIVEVLDIMNNSLKDKGFKSVTDTTSESPTVPNGSEYEVTGVWQVPDPYLG